MFECILNDTQLSETHEKDNIYKYLKLVVFMCPLSYLQKENKAYVFTYVFNVLFSNIL